MTSDEQSLKPSTAASAVETAPQEKKVVLVQPVDVNAQPTRRRLDVGWGEERTSLLGIWMTVFISVYVTLVVKGETRSWLVLLAYASFSGLFASLMLLPFRSGTVRKAFFKFFDWVSGKENANLRAFAAVLVMLALFAVFLILAWLIG